MQTVTCSSRLRDDGSVNIPAPKRRKLGLRTGDRVEIVIYPANGKLRSFEPLTQMSQAKQKRMDELLFHHREGNISLVEKHELEALVLEAQLLTVEKARRSLKKSALK
jgi:bifunctional DNA-binding transcriptional regulator/antitoxin component of YhaV-PrlF toxin-antitoxin module